MIGLEVLIPLTSNDGRTFDGAHHAQFERFVTERFGGLTLLPGVAHGQWIDAGVTYSDASRVYLLALPSITDGAKVREVVEYAKLHYQQLAICIRFLGVVEIL